MTQEERWLARYDEVKSFIETNHRNPSKHRIEEHLMLNFVKHNRKLESLESGSVVFECKEGPFVEHEVEGVLEVKSEGCD